MTQPVDIAPFTPTMRRLVRALGLDGALRLLRWRGGRRLCLPRVPDRTELTQYLEVSEVQALIATFGPGEWITLPKADQLYIEQRNIEIRAAHVDGASLADLATRYGLTSRHIANIVAGSDVRAANDMQRSLFG